MRLRSLWILLLTAALAVCGVLMIFSRGSVPDTLGWSIAHETNGGYHIRTETGTVTGDYLGQYVAINTARQHLDVYVGEKHVLSSCDYGYEEPREARYGIWVEPEFIGEKMRIVFSTLYPGDNELMGSELSFQRINAGIATLDYCLIAICLVLCTASLILVFAFGIRYSGNGGLILFAVLNLFFAAFVASNSGISFSLFKPALLYQVCYISFFGYVLPMFAFFPLVLPDKWRKWSLALIIPPVCYAAACYVLNAARILPLTLTEYGYTYAVPAIHVVLIFILALQPPAENRFAVLARAHLAILAIWAASAAVRLLLLDMRVSVNVEHQLMYGSILLSLTFYGIVTYARQMKELQKREYVINTRAENLLQSYEQVKTHLSEVSGLKHEIKKHLAVLQSYLRDEKYDEARAYLEEYAGQASAVIESAYHEHYLINAVADNLVRKAKILGAKVELNLTASPASIAEHDLYSLLTNITDNALEACARMPEGKKRLIRLTVNRRDPYLGIFCENSMTGEIIKSDDEIQTSKPNGGHGYGIKVIERIVNAYDGMMNIAYGEDRFTITLALRDK